MTDMLVRLYDLPDGGPVADQLAEQGIIIRRAMTGEKATVIGWVSEHFSEGWACECEAAFCSQPVTCMIATREHKIVGFGCYEATCRDYFGPAGVVEHLRGRRIGSGILLACLGAMRDAGYAYAIIGGVGPKEFYSRVAGATEIPGSTPGIYRDLLQ